MMRRTLRIAAAAALFGAGYLTATVTQPSAEAQVGEIMKRAGEAAGESGGPLGSAARLGSTIAGMKQNVEELQGHIDTLEQIQAALGGG